MPAPVCRPSRRPSVDDRGVQRGRGAISCKAVARWSVGFSDYNPRAVIVIILKYVLSCCAGCVPVGFGQGSSILPTKR
jgi:hypothetical protein